MPLCFGIRLFETVLHRCIRGLSGPFHSMVAFTRSRVPLGQLRPRIASRCEPALRLTPAHLLLHIGMCCAPACAYPGVLDNPIHLRM